MSETKQAIEKLTKKLDELVVLQKQAIAIKLYLSGASQDEIAKSLKISKSTVNQMVKGLKKNE